MSERAVIVQGDRSILLDADHPAAESAREVLGRFAELEKAPEHVHTYRLTDLSLWNAAETGLVANEVVASLRSLARFEVPEHVVREVRERMARHGLLTIVDTDDERIVALECADETLANRLAGDAKLGGTWTREAPGRFAFLAKERGPVKQALFRLGYPVADRARLRDGAPLALALRAGAFTPHEFQAKAARAFVDAGSHGVIVLPCGAGKTIVAILAAEAIGMRTLIVTTSADACIQFRTELLQKTTLDEDAIAIFGSKSKSVGAVTLTTYSMLAKKGGPGATGYVHFDRLATEPFGLIVYDEVHLLPAPVFRLTAELQARRRLGLTATLVREDGRAGDVFSLVGPKRYEVPWRDLEKSGHIAQATCFEIRAPLEPSLESAYAEAEDDRRRAVVAANNPAKLEVLAGLVERHRNDRILLLGTYLEGLHAAAEVAACPVIDGDTPASRRAELYDDFRTGRIRRLALSRVGNAAIDLPEANVLVQLSGTMGSRQEEAQRLGRILRPKPGGATFYSLVTRGTVEQEHALHRQLFLVEQGYRYYLEDAPAVVGRGVGVVLH